MRDLYATRIRILYVPTPFDVADAGRVSGGNLGQNIFRWIITGVRKEHFMWKYASSIIRNLKKK